MTLTYMRREINEVPEATVRLLSQSAHNIKAAGAALAAKNPPFIATIARGSSDHAALFLKYAIELTAGRPVASIGPSLASIYGTRLNLASGGVISVSQSGKSPDIVAMAESATASGALTIALCNTVPSPLCDASRHAIDIAAGPELAVAATKSYVAAIVAGLALIAEWTGDVTLARAVLDLPEQFARAVALDWTGPLFEALDGASSLYLLGRGPTLAIASEAALKFKETSGMHAEAYSAAEVLHGPVALVEPQFPVIAFAARDAAESSIVPVADGLVAKGARVFVTSNTAKSAKTLPVVATGHALTDALMLAIPFYGFVEAWSRHKGLDPDKPASLSKITETR